ncbi:Uncharacterised protein [Mycobacteroides abscessus subsp. abscessus]|nr:Uncharacterised protein [Mycobacteroides abscessus subsp. abscessus]
MECRPDEPMAITTSPGRTRSGPSTRSASTMPTPVADRSKSSGAISPGCSAVSPPSSAQPAMAHPSAIPATSSLTRSGTTLPTAM